MKPDPGDLGTAVLAVLRKTGVTVNNATVFVCLSIVSVVS